MTESHFIDIGRGRNLTPETRYLLPSSGVGRIDHLFDTIVNNVCNVMRSTLCFMYNKNYIY